MKKLFLLLFAICMFNSISLYANPKHNLRQALYGAIDKAAEKVKNAPFNKRAIAIFPFDEYHDIINVKLQNMLVKAGFVCISEKDDPMWNNIISEIEWSERKNDILDKKTINTFGKLKAAQILFRCFVRYLEQNETCVYAEIDLQAIEIKTGEIIWGDTFGYSYCINKDMKGIISMNQKLQMLLQKNFAAARKSLNDPIYADKLKKIKTVTLIPLAGDIDNYVTTLASEMLTSSKFMTRNPHIPSLTVVRTFARDGQLDSDAILYGAIRELYTTKPVSGPSGKKIITSYTVNAGIQLFLEEVKTGNILWSKTIPMSEVIKETRDMTAAEKNKMLEDSMKYRRMELELNTNIRKMELEAAAKQRQMELEANTRLRHIELESAIKLNSLEQNAKIHLRKQKLDSASDMIKEDLVDNWKSYLKIIGWIIGGIVILLLAIVAIKAFFSYNNIR